MRQFCYLGNKLWGKNRSIQLQSRMAKVKQMRDKCGRSIVCEGRWAVETLINSLKCLYKPLLKSHYLQPLDIWNPAFSSEILTECTGLNLLLSVCRIRNSEDTSVPWLPRYRGAIDLEGRAPSLTMSLEFKQLCNKVVFINRIVNHCIPILCEVGGDYFLIKCISIYLIFSTISIVANRPHHFNSDVFTGV